MVSLVRQAASSFIDDDCPRMAAAMSFFTVFSLPPLLLLVLIIAGAVVDPSLLQGRIESEMAGFLGEDGARLLSLGMVMMIALLLSRSHPGEAYGAAGSLAVILIWIYYSAATLFFGAEFTQAWAAERESAS